MQRKKQSATLSQLALHFAVFTPNCIKLRSICQFLCQIACGSFAWAGLKPLVKFTNATQD